MNFTSAVDRPRDHDAPRRRGAQDGRELPGALHGREGLRVQGATGHSNGKSMGCNKGLLMAY